MPPPGEPLWTVAEAAAYFTAAGVPCTPEQLERIVSQLPNFPRAGRAPSGPQGGRGKQLYPASALMRLHSKVAGWL